MAKCPYCGESVSIWSNKCFVCNLYLPPKWARILTAIPWRGIVISLGCLVLFLYLTMPAREDGPRGPSICKDNLKQIGFALHAYHDEYGSFPPPFIADENGKPMHGWRVLILPYLDEKPLYNAYDFTKPWNAPENRHVLETLVMPFHCSMDREATEYMTNYVGVFGEGCIFDPAKPVRIRDIKDGTSNTLMVGEVVDLNIPWTKPADVDITQHPGINQPGGFGSRHEGGCQFLLADGSVCFLNETIDPVTLRNLFRRNDGNMVGEY